MARPIASATMQSVATVVTRLALICAASCTNTQVSTISSASTGGSQRSFNATTSGSGSSRHDGRAGSSSAWPRPTTKPPKQITPASRPMIGASASGSGATQTSPR